MTCKIIGKIDTLPQSWECITFGPVTLDTWIDSMFTAHDECASHWCYYNWVYLVVHTLKEHGVPAPKKGALPFKDYSLVLVNTLAHMIEA